MTYTTNAKFTQENDKLMQHHQLNSDAGSTVTPESSQLSSKKTNASPGENIADIPANGKTTADAPSPSPSNPKQTYNLSPPPHISSDDCHQSTCNNLIAIHGRDDRAAALPAESNKHYQIHKEGESTQPHDALPHDCSFHQERKQLKRKNVDDSSQTKMLKKNRIGSQTQVSDPASVSRIGSLSKNVGGSTASTLSKKTTFEKKKSSSPKPKPNDKHAQSTTTPKKVKSKPNKRTDESQANVDLMPPPPGPKLSHPLVLDNEESDEEEEWRSNINSFLSYKDFTPKDDKCVSESKVPTGLSTAVSSLSKVFSNQWEIVNAQKFDHSTDLSRLIFESVGFVPNELKFGSVEDDSKRNLVLTVNPVDLYEDLATLSDKKLAVSKSALSVFQNIFEQHTNQDFDDTLSKGRKRRLKQRVFSSQNLDALPKMAEKPSAALPKQNPARTVRVKPRVRSFFNDDISGKFVPHAEKKGWLVCKKCDISVWPPNCRKHYRGCK